MIRSDYLSVVGGRWRFVLAYYRSSSVQRDHIMIVNDSQSMVHHIGFILGMEYEN